MRQRRAVSTRAATGCAGFCGAAAAPMPRPRFLRRRGSSLPVAVAPPAGRTVSVALVAAAALLWPAAASAAQAVSPAPTVLNVPVDFVLFGLTLLGVALFHHRTLEVALTGLAVIALYKIAFTGFHEGSGPLGLLVHLQHEWVILANLLCLLLGFALLSHHFEVSGVPAMLPRYLPDDWTGAFLMLVIVFVLSAFLDNIAAALIGGAMAHTLFRGRVHIGFLAAIVAASNAGGSGSVVGDTTTTMMWISGVSPARVLPAYAAAVAALIVLGIPAAFLQQKHSPIVKDPSPGTRVDWGRVAVVAAVLVAAITTNVTVNLRFPQAADRFPFIGAAVALALLVTASVRKPAWTLLPGALRGAVFLLALVTCASMMPVETLPAASWQTAFGLGAVSAVFDNIPLTALAINQGGYDWGMLAFTVGYGGSMVWFGSSAGVAISNMYPEAKSVGAWVTAGWFVAAAYVIGFFVMLFTVGWNPGG
jgi:Na+/H+ antiporter NhaD/arsenite permease-like protein